MNLDVLFDNSKVEKLSVITEKMGETSGPTDYWKNFMKQNLKLVENWNITSSLRIIYY